MRRVRAMVYASVENDNDGDEDGENNEDDEAALSRIDFLKARARGRDDGRGESDRRKN